MANHKPLTPVTFLTRAMRVIPQKIAVIDGERSYTYQEFGRRVQALGAALAEHGVRPGDRVAFLAPNGEPLLAAHYALSLIGAVLVAMNIRLAPAEIRYILQHSGATVLVADPTIAPDLQLLKAEVPELRLVIAITSEAAPAAADTTYEAFIERGARLPEPSYQLSSEQDLISINYTSGTTGRPKGVMYTHRGAYLNALGNAVEQRLDEGTRYLWTLPMFHCNGWCYTWAVTAVGGTHICLPKVIPAEVFHLIDREQVSHLSAAPTVLIDLAKFAGEQAVKLDHPLTVMTGGAAPAPQVIQNMEDIGATVVHLYGMTETYGPSTFCQWRPEWNELPFENRVALKARAGVADLMVEQRVVRPDMTDVSPDGMEIGELVIQGNVVMKGYYKDEQATAEAFRGGWLHTGDLAIMHPDGYIEIKDRLKDIIISGGENISTLEVESVIFAHPAVQEVAVVPWPHERWGQVPKAYVVLKAACSLTLSELDAFCRRHLAAYKSPKLLECVPELPKTSTGKIQKHVLRQWAEAGQRAPGAR